MRDILFGGGQTGIDDKPAPLPMPYGIDGAGLGIGGTDTP